MSSSSTNKLQILWDHFIRSEAQSYEKSCWLDVFLAELLALVNEGHDAKDALSFCSVGEGSAATLIGYELLADVHQLCQSASLSPEVEGSESELRTLRSYLTHERGWRCLAVLHVLGVREVSCSKELVGLLFALYAFLTSPDEQDDEICNGDQEQIGKSNPYIRFRQDDDDKDDGSDGLEAALQNKRKKKKRPTGNKDAKDDEHGFRSNDALVLRDGSSTRRRRRRRNQSQGRRAYLSRQEGQLQQRQLQYRNNTGSESEPEVDEEAAGQQRSLALKIRLNPMDFEYFNSVVRSEDELARRWEIQPSSEGRRSQDSVGRRGPNELLDARSQAVLDSSASRFEVSLLVLKLLLGFQEVEAGCSPTAALKFGLDALWALQFTSGKSLFPGLESARLRAVAARLVLTSLERALRSEDAEVGPALVRDGLLPVTLKVLEDACTRLGRPEAMSQLLPEEVRPQQEFVYATLQSLLSFLHWLLQPQQRLGSNERFKSLELFRLFTDSLDGRLAERAILLVTELPAKKEQEQRPGCSMRWACKLVEMLGLLVVALKRARHEQGSRARRKGRPPLSDEQFELELLHHHHDFGSPCLSDSATSITSVGRRRALPCSVSALFVSLAALLRESPNYGSELQVRLVKVMSSAGACCCLPPRILLTSVVSFLKRAHSSSYYPAAALLERVLFKELGGYSYNEDSCETCGDSSTCRSWDFVELYNELLGPDNKKLCHVTMRHLLKVTSGSSSLVKQELLFRVFYPIFLKSKALLENNKTEFSTLKFLIQSCLSAITSLIVNASMYQKFLEFNGLDEVLSLLPNQAFVKNVYAILEISVIMEIKIVSFSEESRQEGDGAARPATKTLFNFLEKETSALLNVLKSVDDEISASDNNKNAEQNSKTKAIFHQASGVWRAVAGVVLCSPKFRSELKNHPIFESALSLTKNLATAIATGRFNGGNKFAIRLFEAILTCCLVASIPNENEIINALANVLMNSKMKLSQGIGSIVEVLLQISMLRPSQEQIVPQQNRTRLSTVTIDVSADWGEAEESSPGEYITADDGYEADVEVPIKTPLDITLKRISHLGAASEVVRGNANAHPTLCSLSIDLLIFFAKQGLNKDKSEVITNALRRVSIICKESISSCAALAGTGAIMRILQGFQDVLENQNPEHEELRHAVLEVFTLLSTRSISPAELVSYLASFKVSSPPLLALLQPLYRLVLTAKAQPNFILSFPTQHIEASFAKDGDEHIKNYDKAENLVKNFRRRHIAQEVCSPWSVHAVCLPVSSELSWSVWLQGCSASLWLRVERGSMNTNNRGLQIVYDSTISSESDSLSDWGLLSDNWSREVFIGSSSPPVPTTILHMLSIGFETLVLETWLDLKSDKLILRLTRPDDKTNRTISETSINGMLPSGRWHHLAMNLKDTILNKHSAVVEVTIWVDGWKEIRAQLPFDGLLVRKPGTTCVMLGQVGQSTAGAWYIGNLMLFRSPVFDNEKALYLASLGPNFTNLAECILSSISPDFASLITSGALNGIHELKVECEAPVVDSNKRKSPGSTKCSGEITISDSKIDWNSLMDATNEHLSDLQDNLLLNYESQKPHVVHLYPQAVANANVVKNFFPSQPGFRVISVPENKVSQQPPLSLPTIAVAKLQCQSFKGLVSSANLIGGMPIFLFLFARVVELNSKEEEQAMALSIVLHLARSDSELLSQYRSEGGASVILKVLESPRCSAGKHMLKAILDAACDSPILVKDAEGESHLISQNSEAVIIEPELIKCTLEAWRTWAAHNTLNLLLESMLFLLKDQHPHREFNAFQLNRVHILETILIMCKEHFLYEEVDVSLDATTGSTVVELIRALMGAPPELPHLVLITDYLILVHKASETYVTHSRHNMYFLLTPLDETRSSLTKSFLDSTPNEAVDILENSKLNKAIANEQIQKGVASRERRADDFVIENDASSQGQDTSAGEDSGIAASEGSNQQPNDKQPTQADKKRACQGLVCEGLLLLLRDALRVLPDCQIGGVLKNVLRVELLLVLSNNPDARVRTALIKTIQVYLQRASDEQVNKFIKQKYFIHLAHQVSLYPGSEPLVVTLENLALKIPGLAAMPVILAMIPRAAATDVNVAKPLVSFVTELITKTSNALKILLEQGLMETIGKSLVQGAHVSSYSHLFRDLHVLLVTIVTKLLDSPGNHHMQTIADLHVILNYAELKERAQCGANKPCVSAIRDAQVALFDGQLDILTSKVSSHSGFRLKSTASYIASASYISALTTSSEHSDHGSRSSSYASLTIGSNSMTREPGKSEFNDRFRMTLNRAVDFLTTADDAPSVSELQLSKRLLAILLHGISSPLNRKSYWMNAWSAKSALRKNTARIMVWLMGPHQSNSTRVYAVRSLMEEPKTKEILTTLLEVHPQIEQKFIVFFWDLLHAKKDEMSSIDAQVCADLEEALKVWEIAKVMEQGCPEMWTDELALLRRELMKERNIWIENQLAAIQRMSNKFEPLVKQLTESAMTITRMVVEEQNKERKLLMEKFKRTRSSEANVMAQWRDLIKRLTHERAAWFFPEKYPTSWELDPTEGPARVRIKLQRCHLNLNPKFFLPEHKYKSEASKVEPPLSYLFDSSKTEANVNTLIERLHTSERIRKMAPAKVVTPQAELSGEALIGETCFYFVPDTPNVPLHTDIALGGLDLAMAGGTVWRLEDIRELHRRRYQLQDRAIEIFLITGRTYLLAFDSSKEREEFVIELNNCNLPRRIPGDDLGEALSLWRNGTLTNWEYITCLNKLAGRSYNDLMQYPVFPFVLADYTSDKINLDNPIIYRNFKKPMAVQDKKNEQHYINNYNYLKQSINEGINLMALNKEPFHYGSHYSNSGTVLHFLVRLPPFTSMFLNYQDDSFDIPDRTFHAIATTWRLTSCDSTTDVKELIPEFFYLPEFLLNFEGFDFGTRQNGSLVGDVELPKWSGGDARLFILAHRAALESDIVREVLPYWIDLVFGFRQTGKPAVEAINVFHPATYYGFDAEQIEDPLERQAFETMVKTYGQTPAQLFTTQHQLPMPNLVSTTPSDILQVIENVHGIKWGNYVGAPGNIPNVCWKHKHKTLVASFVPLATGEVFGLPVSTTLILAYSKGNSMLSSISVQGAGLLTWNSTDGVARLKTKKEQPPRPLIRSSGLDSISIMKSSPDCEQLWIGYYSGRIVVYVCVVTTAGKIEFSSTSPSVLLAHRSRVTAIEISRSFRIAVSGDNQGILVIWDLNSLTYVRSIVREEFHPITSVSISETLGDIAVVYQVTNRLNNHATDNQSELKVFTINARPVGSVSSKRRITALCYSNAVEGVSVNVVATGLDNGIIRFWSSWDLRLVRELVSGSGCGRIIAMTWSCDQHHFYAATADCTVIIWDGERKLSNGTPRFVNLTAL